MASKEINLFTKKIHFSPQEEKIQGMIQVITPVILIVFVVVLVAVLGGSIYIRASDARMNNQMESAKTQISQLEKNEGLYLLLKQKASAITQIINSRFPYLEVFSYLKSIERDNNVIQSITIEESGKVSLIMKIINTDTLDSFVTEILSQANERYNRIEILGLEYNPEGNYVLSLEVSAKPIKQL